MNRKAIKPPPRPRSRRRCRSSVDMLPAVAKDGLDEATSQLRERTLSKDAILERLNSRLTAMGLKPLSRSAFNRWSIQLNDRLNLQEEEDRISVTFAQFLASAASKSLVDADDTATVLALSQAFRSAITNLLTGPE